MEYTTVDRIFNRLYRDLRDTNLNESNVLEWIGEALDFLKVADNQEEAIAFLEVSNYQAVVPTGLTSVLQVARNNSYVSCEEAAAAVVEAAAAEETLSDKVFLNCNGTPIVDYEIAYYRPYFDLQWEYDPWLRSSLYTSQYTPVRLANHTLFKTIVCRETGYEDLYNGQTDEYTIVGTQDKKFQFSFESGSVAVSYLRTALDTTTGYPLIPDQISHITAIVYYVKWKISEWWAWNGRDGSIGIAQDSERKWLKYVRQAKNWAKMPKSIDQYQNLLEESHQLIPRHRRYYGFFGSLGKPEDKNFNDPDHRVYH
jgi:hypothetical protein